MLAEARDQGAGGRHHAAQEYIEESAASALVTVSDEEDARFIVVGSYGERPLKGAIIGATPYKLIHLAERPVIVVRIPD